MSQKRHFSKHFFSAFLKLTFSLIFKLIQQPCDFSKDTLLLPSIKLSLALAVGMFARFADVPLPVVEDPHRVVQGLLEEQRAILRVRYGIFRLVEIEGQPANYIEGGLLVAMTARISILRLFIELAMIAVGSANWNHALRR